MRHAPILCRNCKWQCHIDKRYWRKVVCVNRQCGAKFLVEATAATDGSSDEVSDGQKTVTQAGMSHCPECHGPVTVRHRYWQKATCMNSQCRTKFLVEADEDPAQTTGNHVEIIVHPKPAIESIVMEETPPPGSNRRTAKPAIIESSYPHRKRSRQRFSRKQMFVCMIAFVPFILLLVFVSLGDNDFSRFLSSSFRRIAQSFADPDDLNLPQIPGPVIPGSSDVPREFSRTTSAR